MARADSGRREYHDRRRDYYGVVSGKITNHAAKNGARAALPIDYSGPVAGTAANARLSKAQFARLIEHSEADEIRVRL